MSASFRSGEPICPMLAILKQYTFLCISMRLSLGPSPDLYACLVCHLPMHQYETQFRPSSRSVCLPGLCCSHGYRATSLMLLTPLLPRAKGCYSDCSHSFKSACHLSPGLLCCHWGLWCTRWLSSHVCATWNSSPSYPDLLSKGAVIHIACLRRWVLEIWQSVVLSNSGSQLILHPSISFFSCSSFPGWHIPIN